MKTINIPAPLNGQPGVYTENMDQPGFSVVSTNASFVVQVRNQTKITVSRSQSIGTKDGPNLGRVTFYNSGSTAITVQIGDFGDTRPTTIAANCSTFLGPLSGPYLGGTDTDFPGVLNGCERKVIHIQNVGVAGKLVYVMFNGKQCATLYPDDPPTPFETNADISVSSTLGGSGPYQILEIFYSNPLQTNQ